MHWKSPSLAVLASGRSAEVDANLRGKSRSLLDLVGTLGISENLAAVLNRGTDSFRFKRLGKQLG